MASNRVEVLNSRFGESKLTEANQSLSRSKSSSVLLADILDVPFEVLGDHILDSIAADFELAIGVGNSLESKRVHRHSFTASRNSSLEF